MNKKAQIGTGLTWVPATIIIFFIIAAYTFASFILYKTGNSNTINFEKSQDSIRTSNLLSFLQNKEISDWADNPNTIQHSEMFNLENVDEKTKEKYENLKQAFAEFATALEIEEPCICLKTEDKTIFIEKTEGEFIWGVVSPHQQCTTRFTSEIYDKVFVLSEKNKLIEVIYADKTNY